jgi:pimeloyl-ACP methyl ester carboxylesterase
VREHARALIEDILDALGLDEVPVIGHSLGGMFALWHVATGSERISEVIAIGEPAVALPGVRVRMPLSLLTVRGLGAAVLRSPSPPCLPPPACPGARLRRSSGRAGSLIEALRLSARKPENARTVASLMHAIDRFRRPRPECPHNRGTRRDHHTHDLHHRIRRPLPIHRARPAVDRPDSRRQAL